MKNVIFKDNAHEKAYNEITEKMGKKLDCYRSALAYLISLDTVCRSHVENLYSFEERCIIPECLFDGWQTGTSRKTTLLAFNLFTGHTAWLPEEFTTDCTPAEIFCSEYAVYYAEALKIRYPEYFNV